MLAFTLRASTSIHQGQTQISGLIRWTDGSFGQHAKEPPCSRSQGVLIDNTQQPWAGGQWERWAVQRKSLSSCDCWVGECTLQLQCSQKKTLLSTLCFPLKIYSREKLRVELDNMKLCWSSHEGKCSSWICHACLYEAVFSSTSYLLWAQTVIILTTQHTRLSGQPPPRFFSVPLLWQMIQTAWH